MQTETPPELLVGTATGDDAAVWRLDDERALVSTADFITPVVDDARTWGRVAAANAVSDVYAMGGRPLFALNLVGWNRWPSSSFRSCSPAPTTSPRPDRSSSWVATRSTIPNPSLGCRSQAKCTPTES